MKHTDIINSLSLEQKCALLSGGTVFTTSTRSVRLCSFIYSGVSSSCKP